MSGTKTLCHTIYRSGHRLIAIASILLLSAACSEASQKAISSISFLGGYGIPLDMLEKKNTLGISGALAVDFFVTGRLSLGVTGAYTRLPGKTDTIPYYYSNPYGGNSEGREIHYSDVSVKEIRGQFKIHLGPNLFSATVFELGGGLQNEAITGEGSKNRFAGIIGINQRISFGEKRSGLEFALHVQGTSGNMFLTFRTGLFGIL